MLVIPLQLWERMLGCFESGPRNVEQVAYFDGVMIEGPDATCRVATTLTIPLARLEAGHFAVSADDMSAAGKHLRQNGLKRLAQVHTHPSDWVGHSNWDDQHAYSQSIGAVSIVLPNYGVNQPQLSEAGVHVRHSHGWKALTQAQIQGQISVVPSLVDLRPSIISVHEHKSVSKPPLRKRWWHIFTFWRH